MYIDGQVVMVFADGDPYSAVSGACVIEVIGGFPNEV